jgi:hypothetical protein
VTVTAETPASLSIRRRRQFDAAGPSQRCFDITKVLPVNSACGQKSSWQSDCYPYRVHSFTQAFWVPRHSIFIDSVKL